MTDTTILSRLFTRKPVEPVEPPPGMKFVSFRVFLQRDGLPLFGLALFQEDEVVDDIGHVVYEKGKGPKGKRSKDNPFPSVHRIEVLFTEPESRTERDRNRLKRKLLKKIAHRARQAAEEKSVLGAWS